MDDDDECIVHLLSRAFELRGFQTLTAANGQKAIDIISQSEFTVDCVVSDIGMPLMDGWELLFNLRENNNHLPVIIISALKENKIRALREGAESFYHKPFNVMEFIDSIEVILERQNEFEKQNAYLL